MHYCSANQSAGNNGSFSALEAMAVTDRLQKNSAAICRSVLNSSMMFEPGIGKVIYPASNPGSLWLVGDIHGDLTALVNIWNYICTQALRYGESSPKVLFLGDLIDRGPQSSQCLLFLFWVIVENPGRIGLIPGNHDLALSYSAETGFCSSVTPAEYAESLFCSSNRDDAIIAKTAIKLFDRSPAAVVLPDGCMFSHAGFPHPLHHADIRSLDDLESNAFLEDFAWLRLSTTSSRKRKNLNRVGGEFGKQDFLDFCQLMTRLGKPVHRLVRGHDHHEARMQMFSVAYQQGILTLNSMSSDVGERDLPVSSCIGYYQAYRMPVVHRVPLPGPEPPSPTTETAVPANDDSSLVSAGDSRGSCVGRAASSQSGSAVSNSRDETEGAAGEQGTDRQVGIGVSMPAVEGPRSASVRNESESSPQAVPALSKVAVESACRVCSGEGQGAHLWSGCGIQPDSSAAGAEPHK